MGLVFQVNYNPYSLPSNFGSFIQLVLPKSRGGMWLGHLDVGYPLAAIHRGSKATYYPPPKTSRSCQKDYHAEQGVNPPYHC